MADDRKSVTSSTYSGHSGSGETAMIATWIENKPQPPGTDKLMFRTSDEAEKKCEANKAARNKEAESKN